MGITGLIPFLEKASRKANVEEFSGCTVAVDTYCWLHKGAYACADKLVRGEDTDVHIKYCLKYVSMLLSNNIKPILVFDGRHLPAKALTELERRKSRDISKKRAAELLSLGKIKEAHSCMQRSVDITHEMALSLIKECRKRNVDCIVAPYEADAQLAYLNIKNIAHLVITEDSDLVLFGCTKVLFKMTLDGFGNLVETVKLPLVMRCPIEHYTFDKFRQMCIMSGCDYLDSLPGIGLAKARQFITATQDPNIANALRKLPSYFNRSSLTVTDEYRENFLKAEATFKHQYVYDPIERNMVRLMEPDDEDVETALCVNAGELLDSKTAFQLAIGNLDPFTLKKMDSWHPDHRDATDRSVKTDSWAHTANHPSIWSKEFIAYLNDARPWQKKVERPEPIIQAPKTRTKNRVVNLVAKYVPETQDQSLTIENLSNMYCAEPVSKKQKTETLTENTQGTENPHNVALIDEYVEASVINKDKSPILVNKDISYKKFLQKGLSKKLSGFPRTVLDGNIVESKFFNSPTEENNEVSEDIVLIEESPEKKKPEMNRESRNPFKVRSVIDINQDVEMEKTVEIDSQCSVIPDSQLENSQKENSVRDRSSPTLASGYKNSFGIQIGSQSKMSQDSIIENTYPYERLVTPVNSQLSYGDTPPHHVSPPTVYSQPARVATKSTCRVPGLKRTVSLPSNQPTLLSKFGFQRKPVLKR